MNYQRQELVEAFHSAVSTALEDMAFEQVDIIDDEEMVDEFEKLLEKSGTDEPESLAIIWSKIDLNSPLQGTLVLIMGQNFAENICGALFGFGEENPPEEIIRDSTAEMLNTIGGCFMKELIPQNLEYQIGFPETGLQNYKDNGPDSITIYFKMGENIFKGIVSGISCQ